MDQQIGNNLKQEVLMLALARHDGPYSSTAWCLAKAFSKQGPVVYVDNPFTLSDIFKKSKREQIRKRYWLGFFRKREVLQPEPSLNLKVVVPPVVLPINWLPHGWLYRMLGRFNNWLLKRTINQVLKTSHFNRYLYINSFNPFYGKDGDFSPQPAFYIYHSVDEIAHSNYVAKHGPALEMEAMKNADRVVSTSRQLQKKASALTGHAAYIPNAADVELFSIALENSLPVPAELEGETRKVICYTGHVDKRLNYELLVSVARAHPEKLFLMVGPVSGNEVEKSGFSGLPNVKLIGKKKIEELPAFLQHAHCTIIPFKCNDLTASIYPLKINEYLAAGKGVVSTSFSTDIKDFSDVVSLADSDQAFAEAIEKVVSSDSDLLRQTRLQRAKKNTWEARVDAFWSLSFDEMNNSNRQKVAEEKTYEEAVK